MKEHEIVKKVCLSEIDANINFENVEQYQVLGLLCMHRCAGIAYHNLLQSQLLTQINREMRTTLQAIYESNVRKNKAMLKSLNYMSIIFQKIQFPYALLKGAKLIELYPLGTRTSNDIDLLINRENVPQITKILTEEGFRQGFIRNNEFKEASRKEIVNALLNRGETIPFVKQVEWTGMKYLEIDVNISVDETSCSKKNVVKKMLEHVVPQIHTDSETLYILDAVDFFIHLCTHLYKEATTYQWVEMGRDLSLYKFLDIYMYWKNCMKEEYIPILKRRTEEYNLREAVYYSLYHTNKLWNMENDSVQQFLDDLYLVNNEVLNTVYDPSTSQRYNYLDLFEERIFNERHREMLEI